MSDTSEPISPFKTDGVFHRDITIKHGVVDSGMMKIGERTWVFEIDDPDVAGVYRSTVHLGDMQAKYEQMGVEESLDYTLREIESMMVQTMRNYAEERLSEDLINDTD